MEIQSIAAAKSGLGTLLKQDSRRSKPRL